MIRFEREWDVSRQLVVVAYDGYEASYAINMKRYDGN